MNEKLCDQTEAILKRGLPHPMLAWEGLARSLERSNADLVGALESLCYSIENETTAAVKERIKAARIAIETATGERR